MIVQLSTNSTWSSVLHVQRTGESEGPGFSEPEVDRLLLPVRPDRPLVEAVRHDQTAVLAD
jgi:hypothetical protein